MTVQDIIKFLEQIAPPRFAADWDRVGLMLGSPKNDVKSIAVALRPSRKALARCVDEKIDLLVVYHPLFPESVHSLVKDTPWMESLYQAIGNGLSVYVLHTSYDAAPDNPTDVLVDLLELDCYDEPLIPSAIERQFKIAVFTPPEAVDAVRNAMAEAGAGLIGDYSHCSFMTEGTGTFLPLEGAEPYSGEGIGKLAREKEFRLEMLVPEEALGPVIAAMIEAHPYEEVAYDLYPLLNERGIYGTGRICDLNEPARLEDIVDLVGERLALESALVVGDKERQISRIAIFAGEGDAHIEPAYRIGADLIISGDLGALGLDEVERFGMAVIDVNSSFLLLPGMQVLYEKLEAKYQPDGIKVTFIGW